MAVRAKFVCRSKEANSNKEAKITLEAVVDDSPENANFFAATPSGEITIFLANAFTSDQFEEGREYYVDFFPAGPSPA